jgi:hypothetical protein
MLTLNLCKAYSSIKKDVCVAIPPYLKREPYSGHNSFGDAIEVFQDFVKNSFTALSGDCALISHTEACLSALDRRILQNFTPGEVLVDCHMEEEITVCHFFCLEYKLTYCSL